MDSMNQKQDHDEVSSPEWNGISEYALPIRVVTQQSIACECPQKSTISSCSFGVTIKTSRACGPLS